MKRPFYGIGLAYFLALLCAGLVSLRITAVLGILCLLGLLGTWLVHSEAVHTVPIRAMLAAACIAFCAFSAKELLVYRPLLRLDGTVQTVTGRVRQVTQTASGFSYCELKTDAGTLPAGTLLWLYLPEQVSPPARGDRIETVAELSAVPSAAEETALLPTRKAGGVYLCAYAGERMVRLEPTAPTVSDRITALREAAVARLLTLMPGDEGALAAAICLGDKSFLSASLRDAFRGSGVSHLLVVSGLHVSAVTLSLYTLLRRLRLPRTAAAPCTLAALLFFSLFIGLTPSVVRSGLLHALWLLGLCFRRQPDSRNSLGLALLLLMLADPYAAYDIGLLLSFGSTWGLLVLEPSLQRVVFSACRLKPHETGLRRIPAWILSSLCVTAAATLPLLPLTAYLYRELSLSAPLTNLLAVTPAMLFLGGGLLTLFTGSIAAPLCLPFRGITQLLGRYLLTVTRLLSGILLPLRDNYLLLGLIGSILLCLCGFRLLRGRGLRIAAALSVVACASGMLLHTGVMRGVTVITALNGRGSLAVLLERDGHSALLLSGESDSWNTAAAALSVRGLTSPDLVAVIGDSADFGPAFASFAADAQAKRYVVSRPASYDLTEEAAGCPLAVCSPQNAADFWNDTVLTAWEDGYWALRIGQTRLLICPKDGSTASLPAAYRTADLVLFSGAPPAEASLFSADIGWWFCRRSRLEQARRALPWGLYPIHTVQTEGELRLTTRGRGDLSS